MAEQRSDFYVGEKFSTYEEFADIEKIIYLYAHMPTWQNIHICSMKPSIRLHMRSKEVKIVSITTETLWVLFNGQ